MVDHIDEVSKMVRDIINNAKERNIDINSVEALEARLQELGERSKELAELEEVDESVRMEHLGILAEGVVVYFRICELTGRRFP